MTNPLHDWNKGDECLLQSLIERKQAFQAAAIQPVEKVVHVLTLSDGIKPNCLETFRKHMVRMLVNNADEIRDALAPFDSGVRVEHEKTGG